MQKIDSLLSWVCNFRKFPHFSQCQGFINKKNSYFYNALFYSAWDSLNSKKQPSCRPSVCFLYEKVYTTKNAATFSRQSFCLYYRYFWKFDSNCFITFRSIDKTFYIVAPHPSKYPQNTLHRIYHLVNGCMEFKCKLYCLLHRQVCRLVKVWK